MLEAGIVGLPGSGKTTLFSALTGGQGAVGTVPIPDERLEPVARTVGAAAAVGARGARAARARAVDDEAARGHRERSRRERSQARGGAPRAGRVRGGGAPGRSERARLRAAPPVRGGRPDHVLYRGRQG